MEPRPSPSPFPPLVPPGPPAAGPPRRRRSPGPSPGALLLVLLVLLVLGACACSGEAGRAAAPAHAGGTALGFPRTVEAFGGQVRLEHPPLRILPATATALDLVFALVPGERIVAVPHTAPDYANAPLGAEDWERLPRFRHFQGEDVLPLRPDLVVTHAYQRAEATRVLEQAGVPVARLPDVGTFEDLLTLLSTLGRLVGEEERAAQLALDLEARRAALAQGPDLSEMRALTYLDFGTGGWTAGTGTTGDLLIGLAGLRNAAAEAGLSGNVELDHERLITLDPELIVVRSTVAGEDGSPTAALLRASSALAGLRAVREGAIVVLPARLFAAESHHLLDGAELLRAEAARIRRQP